MKRFGSPFNGIFGFGLAGEAAGMECAWVSEIDKHCNSLMAQRRPSIPNLGDIRDVGRATTSAVDVLVGGFPCQDLSVAGKRAGLAGERSGLWFEFHRIIAELGPQFVVVENVPGLLSSNGGRDFAVILRGLVELGYGVCWRILDAQYFGVPQRRRRVFIVGSLGDGRAAEILFEREGGEGNTQASSAKRQRLAPTLKGGSGERGRPELLDGNADGLILNGDVTGTIQSSGAGTARSGNERSETDMLVTAFEWQQGVSASEKDRVYPVRKGNYAGSISSSHVDAIAYTLPASARGTGDGHGNAWNSNYLPIYDMTGMTSRTNRSNPQRGDPAPSLHSGTANMLVSGVRRLTPTECERLQGFPDGWTEGFADSVRYRMLGNAVAVPVVTWLMKRIASK